MKQWVMAATLGAVMLSRSGSVCAEPVDAFAAAVKDSTGEYNRSWVLTRLMTFKLGAKCWAKLPDKELGAVHAASFATRDLVELAKKWTGDDWSSIESQNNSDREANKQLIAPMMDAFKQRASIAIRVDGDDCDAKQASLWLRYWTTLASALNKYPPPSGKAFVTLDVTSAARAVTVRVDKGGTTFAITAPKDIEARSWSGAIERPFQQLVAGIPDDFAYAVKVATGEHTSAWALTKLHTFKVGAACRAKLPDPELGAVHAATFVTRDLTAYARKTGAEDWAAIEGQSANDPQTNRDIVARDMDAFAKRFSLTISVEGNDCDARQNALWLKYWTTIAGALDRYPPKAKKVAITLNVTAKAKAVKVATGKDGATFTITAPRDIEAAAWSDAIEKAFAKVTRK